MNLLRSISKSIDHINIVVGKAVSWGTLGMVVVTFLDVVMRYLFNTSYVFTQELEWHLFSFVFLMGAGYTLYVECHVRVEKITEGQIKIQIFAGGELVPPMETFQAVSDGTVEMGSGAAYYWAGKLRAAQWFTAVPFGLNAQGMNAWFYSGGGLKLWEEAYAPFNLVPRPIGNTGVQVGGWFNKKLNTMADFKGLKMRIPGLGGKVFTKAGGTVTLTPGGGIFTNLERGVIDASEWVGPYHDNRLGLPKAARYYYPGWHEPGTALEIIFNKKVYDAMPEHLRLALDACAAQTNVWQLSEFETHNGEYLEKIMASNKNQILQFPEEVMKTLRELSREALEEEAGKDPLSRKVHDAFMAFKKRVGTWGQFSEAAYYQLIAEKLSA